MGKLLIVNGSPRAPRSNSRRYIEQFLPCWGETADQYTALRGGPLSPEDCTDLLLVFPLYADGIPAVLMRTLKELAVWRGTARPRIHVLVNCGFLEPEQTRPAVEMVRFFCKRYGFPWGMALQIGSGEAILNTPFSFLVRRRDADHGDRGRLEISSHKNPTTFADYSWEEVCGMDTQRLWECFCLTGEPLVYLLYQAALDQESGGGISA